MRVQSLQEAKEQAARDREPLDRKSPFLDHDGPEWKAMSHGGNDEKAYYIRIYKSLTTLQKCILNQHAVDIRKAAKERNSIWGQIEASQTYQLLKSAGVLGYQFLIIWAGAPFQLITRPFQMFYVTLYFGSIYGFLFVANVLFLIAQSLGVNKLITVLSDKQAAGWSVINWLDINLFNRQRRVIDNARLPLQSDVTEFLIQRRAKGNPDMIHLSKPKPLEFNVDLARAILLMCAIVYERDVSFVQKAACASISKTSEEDDPSEGVLFLLKSEEAMFRYAAEWNIRFASIADFRKLSGPFAGAFYDFENNGADDNPWIVVVLKGTTPNDFKEWLTDCACNFESAGDFLGDGLAHGGFYQALFPSRSSGEKFLPYMRMVETIKLIAKKAVLSNEDRFRLNQPPVPRKKVNLFIGGHSLGAGIAQLLYARLLECPDDLGDDVILRDGYVFGTPRACDFKLASRVDYNISKPVNAGRQLWRISNRSQSTICGDVVTRVPPGFADQRSIRSAMQDGSYYAYAAIGVRVDLTPNASTPPFYDISDVPIGHDVLVVKREDEAEHEFARSRGASRYTFPQDLVQLSMWIITVLVPILHDHFPASYMDSLNMIQAKTASVKKGVPSPIQGKQIAAKQNTTNTNSISLESGPGNDKSR